MVRRPDFFGRTRKVSMPLLFVSPVRERPAGPVSLTFDLAMFLPFSRTRTCTVFSSRARTLSCWLASDTHAWVDGLIADAPLTAPFGGTAPGGGGVVTRPIHCAWLAGTVRLSTVEVPLALATLV